MDTYRLTQLLKDKEQQYRQASQHYERLRDYRLQARLEGAVTAMREAINIIERHAN